MLKGPANPTRDDGFTLLEMIIVLLLASVVLVVAMGALISLDNTASRHDSLVQEEQSASTAMGMLERDIRSATAISFPAGEPAAEQLQLAVLEPDGSTTNVLWVYSPSAGTLTREVEVPSGYQPDGYSVSGVVNGVGTPVFTYYDSGTADISGTTTSNIAVCATAVGIDLRIWSGAAGVGAFEENAEVALTDQAQALTTPGNGQCGTV